MRNELKDFLRLANSEIFSIDNGTCQNTFFSEHHSQVHIDLFLKNITLTISVGDLKTRLKW